VYLVGTVHIKRLKALPTCSWTQQIIPYPCDYPSGGTRHQTTLTVTTTRSSNSHK